MALWILLLKHIYTCLSKIKKKSSPGSFQNEIITNHKTHQSFKANNLKIKTSNLKKTLLQPSPPPKL